MDDIASEELADLRARELGKLQAEIAELRQKANHAETERDQALADVRFLRGEVEQFESIYEQANEALKDKLGEIETIEQNLQGETETCIRLSKALEQIAPHGYGLEQNATDEERADYWAGIDLRHRRIAREALEWKGKTAETA